MNTDEMTAKRLDANKRDALVAAYRSAAGMIAARIMVAGEENPEGIESHKHLFDLAEMGLMRSEAIDESNDGTRDHVYAITGKGRRVARFIRLKLETIYIKIVPNDRPNDDGHWITVENFDIVSLEKARSTVDQFYMLQPHIPEGHHPVAMERVKPEGVE